MRIDIMTLFPDAVEAMMGSSIIGRARERGFVTIQTHQIRDYTTNKQMQVDDYPYGGGRGAVMQADPLYRCWQHICDEAGERVHTIYMSPCGRVLTQQVARELKAQYDHLILVCGHYEGVDQRFLDECVDEEISTGDFVLTGGEIPAMALADCLCRMVPGVLPEEIPRLFDRFYKTDRSRSLDKNGVGLGLSICRTIMNVHEGEIFVRSQPGEYTEFVFGLKADPAHYKKGVNRKAPMVDASFTTLPAAPAAGREEKQHEKPQQ